MSESDTRIATDQLVRELQADLRRRARAARWRIYRGETMRTTVLINEAYLQFANRGHHEWADRNQFLVAATVAMRNILKDYLDRIHARKRDPGSPIDPFDEELTKRGGPAEVARRERLQDQMIDFDRAHTALAAQRPRHAQIAELILFSGLTLRETSEVVGTSLRQTERDWSFARRFIAAAMERSS
ncbi:hypothetical protein K8I85_12010 [bacterium]|nr:hypothetical protein [bacterium]